MPNLKSFFELSVDRIEKHGATMFKNGDSKTTEMATSVMTPKRTGEISLGV